MSEAASIGRRIREARQRRDMTQQELASALALPRTAITNIEAGARHVSTQELATLATLFHLPPSAFADGNFVSDLGAMRERALSDAARSPELGPVIDRVIDLCREGAELRRLLDQDTAVSMPDYAQPIAHAGDAVRQGEAHARDERRRLGLGDAPIANLPALIGDQGIWVAAARDEFPDDVSGLFLHHATIGMAVLINAGHAPARQRFSYAHEYGHALFDRQEELRLTENRNSGELVEKRANAFAAGFLMPSGGVRQQLRARGKGQPSRRAQFVYSVATDLNEHAEIRPRAGSQTVTFQDAAILARHFGVSYQAMVWRLRNLDLLDTPATSALIARGDDGRRYLAMLGLPEPFDIGSAVREPAWELRMQIVHLALEAYRREEISQGRLREIGRKLHLPAAELLELAEAAKPA